MLEQLLTPDGDVDGLREGHYLLPRRRGVAVDIPVRIWRGPPLDPDSGEEMDRSHRWHVEVGGVLIGDQALHFGQRVIRDFADVWPVCAGWPTTAADYAFRVDRAEWATQHDPIDPFGRSDGRIDCMTAPLPFGD